MLNRRRKINRALQDYKEQLMATFGLIEYEDAGLEARAVFDDIRATRKTDWINNFWKALAHDPVTMRRTWESIKEAMASGALDPLTKELISLTCGSIHCTIRSLSLSVG